MTDRITIRRALPGTLGPVCFRLPIHLRTSALVALRFSTRTWTYCTQVQSPAGSIRSVGLLKVPLSNLVQRTMLSSLLARVHTSLPILSIVLIASSLSIKLVTCLWLRSLELVPIDIHEHSTYSSMFI